MLGPFFAERLGLIPGPTDLGVSVKATGARTEVHVGVLTLEQVYRAVNSQLLERRLLAQTHVEF